MSGPGSGAELRVVLARDVPGDVVGADGERPRARRASASRVASTRPPPGTRSRSSHSAPEPVPDEDDVARGAARRPRPPRSSERHAAPIASRRARPRTSSRTPRAMSGATCRCRAAVKPVGRLDPRVDLDAAVQRAGPRPDGRARRCACRSARPSRAAPTRSCAPRPAGSWRRCSVSSTPGLVRREHRRARVARLLEVVGARARSASRARHSTGRALCRGSPGRSGSAEIAST